MKQIFKRRTYIVLLFLLALLGNGCKKYLDVNKDPNNPADVQESLILTPVETAISTVLAGGCLTIGNYQTVGVVNAYWTQQLALNQLAPQPDVYRLRPDDIDQFFLSMYSTMLQNLKILNSKAEQRGNHVYGAIAKILTAYTLGAATDMWGDIPYSQAFDGKLKVPYDKQEDVYKTLQSLLDSAITESTLTPGLTTPGSDDLLYGGKIASWVKFAYTLKARYYMHLTKAPGYNAVTQANLALAALQKGFTKQSEEATFAAYSDNSGSEGPWYENIDPSAGPNVLASTLVDSLKKRNDPRLPILATVNTDSIYKGRLLGDTVATDAGVYSVINEFYAGPDAPQPLLTWSEALFLKAEATLIVSGAATAEPIYLNGIKSHMTKLGLDLTDPDVVAYLAARGSFAGAIPLQRIMEEKSIANFLSIENFNDWRRTGYPALSIVLSPYVPSIPRRYPYPLAEITSNPQPQQSAKITDRVWWDAP